MMCSSSRRRTPAGEQTRRLLEERSLHTLSLLLLEDPSRTVEKLEAASIGLNDPEAAFGGLV